MPNDAREKAANRGEKSDWTRTSTAESSSQLLSVSEIVTETESSGYFEKAYYLYLGIASKMTAPFADCSLRSPGLLRDFGHQ